MSSKTRTRKNRVTASTTSPEQTTRSEPEPNAAARTETEDRLWAALHAHPDSTAAELSSAAKIGKSTAGKILARWANDGSVTRTAGIAEGGRRAADLWTITTIDNPTEITTAPTDADTHVTDAAPTDKADTGTPDAQSSDAEPPVLTPSDPVDTAPATDAESGTGSDTGNGEKSARLAPGALRGMVEDYLREHAGEQFSPSAIGKGLGRSSGAVHNALEKLVSDGYAVKTQDTPKRYTLAATKADVDG